MIYTMMYAYKFPKNLVLVAKIRYQKWLVHASPWNPSEMTYYHKGIANYCWSYHRGAFPKQIAYPSLPPLLQQKQAQSGFWFQKLDNVLRRTCENTFFFFVIKGNFKLDRNFSTKKFNEKQRFTPNFLTFLLHTPNLFQ